jgi:hypothetical protein
MHAAILAQREGHDRRCARDDAREEQRNARGGKPVPKREKSKRLQVVITEEQDSLLTKTAYQLSNPERLVSKSEVVRLGIEMLNRAVEEGALDPELLKALEES